MASFNESRGDTFDHWGGSTWLFELADNNNVIRQIEIYENGNSLKYKEDTMLDDDYGMLSDQAIDQIKIKENNFKEIKKEKFEEAWIKSGFIDGKVQW